LTEGLALAVRHAFGRLGLHRAEANIHPGNRASRALVRRLGFRREGFASRYLKIGGRWRDHERWALGREAGTGTRPARRRGSAAAGRVSRRKGS
jgi:ribosomal-protein-alanine N-acetyltransferase